MYIFLESALPPASHYILHVCASDKYMPHDHMATLYTTYLPTLLGGSAKEYILSHQDDTGFHQVFYACCRTIMASQTVSYDKVLELVAQESLELGYGDQFDDFVKSKDVAGPVLEALKRLLQDFYNFDQGFKVKAAEYSDAQ